MNEWMNVYCLRRAINKSSKFLYDSKYFIQNFEYKIRSKYRGYIIQIWRNKYKLQNTKNIYIQYILKLTNYYIVVIKLS